MWASNGSRAARSGAARGGPSFAGLVFAKGGAFDSDFGFDFESASDFAFMPKHLKRYYGKHHLHFITCTCYRRLPLLGSVRAKKCVREDS
jgi:hypothetical protein